jgi:hypothetical protein
LKRAMMCGSPAVAISVPASLLASALGYQVFGRGAFAKSE